MKAVLIHIKSEFTKLNLQEKSIETLFIGGGTPSTIDPLLFKPFLDFVQPYLQENAEITTEANPNSATNVWLQGMHKLGINRISFGVQSFNGEKLKMLGRNHTASMAKEAIKNADQIGFENISLDLIYGTSIDNKKLLESDLDTAFSLPINHLSAYSLTLEEETPFFDTPKVQKDDEDIARWFAKEIEKRGLPQYEVSNFGTYQSQHNLGYWQHKEYIGIGSGAVGFLQNRRFYTQKSIEMYIQDPLNIDIETLDQEAVKSEKILLGLRSIVGFSQDLLSAKQLQNAKLLTEEKKLLLHKKIFLNPNYFLSDEIALFILEH